MAKQTGKPAQQKSAKRPVHEVRMGRIKATIWENETREGIRHNVSLTRIYKDGEAWKDSTTFGRDDLPLVAKVADLAHTWVYDHGKVTTNAESTDKAEF